MRIEFDPTNPTEAAAVRAMLTALAPASGGVVTSTESRLVGEVPSEQIVKEPYYVQVVGRGLRAAPEGVEVTEFAPPETDSTGTPWDERIHSTPATTNKDGTWRAKRGVTAEQIAEVRAEREANALAGETVEEHIAEVAAAFEEPVTVPPAPPVTAAPPAPIAVEHADGSVTLPDSPIPPVYAPAPAPPAPAGTSAPSFLDVMKAITAAQKDGKIDTAKVKELCAAVGAGESTMGLNGPDNGDKRVSFMALLAEETK